MTDVSRHERGSESDYQSDADTDSEDDADTESGADGRVSVNHQMVFSDDTESGMEVGEPAETSLGQFGVDIDHRDRESRLDRPSASSFGVDDRAEVVRSSSDISGEEVPLFVRDEKQMSLDGSAVGFQWLFD